MSDNILSSFRRYYEISNSHDEGRFSKLLLRFVPLLSFPADLVEELFFSGLVGNVRIESVIPYILGMHSEDQHDCAGEPKTAVNMPKNLISDGDESDTDPDSNLQESS